MRGDRIDLDYSDEYERARAIRRLQGAALVVLIVLLVAFLKYSLGVVGYPWGIITLTAGLCFALPWAMGHPDDRTRGPQ